MVIIEGLGPPPRDDGRRGALDDRRLRAHRSRAAPATPDSKDLEAAYRRLRERNPRLPEAKARELALLGTRAREDGTLEWKFDAMLTTIGVNGPFDLEYAMALWRRIAAPTLIVHGAESGEFWRGTAGRDLPRARRPRAPPRAASANARFVEIAGAGHMVHFDRPRELVTAMRDFLLEGRA